MSVTRASTLSWHVAIAILGIWSAVNGVIYAVDSARRYRAESAWLVFAAVLLIGAVYSTIVQPGEQKQTDVRGSRLRIWLPVALVGGLLLYWPVLSIGLLSDDFVLLDRARRGVLVDASWEYIRPLPLALWQAVLHWDPAGVPLLLHLVNVAGHSLNAWPVLIFSTRIGLTLREGLIAAALFLTFPGAVEAVSWASGIFDILLVTCVLAAGITITAAALSPVQVISILMLLILALATKETAVIMPVLLAISIVASRNVTRSKLAIVSVALVIAGAYVFFRFANGFSAAPPTAQLSGYAIKEMLTRPFGSLGLPFHTDLLHEHSWVAVVLAVFWPMLFAGAAMRWRGPHRDATLALLCCAWVLTTVAPLGTMLFVAEDLQGSRYLYAASAAWPILFVVLFRVVPDRWMSVAVVPMLMLNVWAISYHQRFWIEAAAERDRILNAYQRRPCLPRNIEGLPDHVRGAYVFRNGFAAATGAMSTSSEHAGCVLRWEDGAFREIGKPLPSMK